MEEEKKRGASPLNMEDNLKKAVTEMMVLALLAREDMYANQITQELETQSEGAVNIVFPYSAIYRLIGEGYIWEAYKKVAPDGRRRQYYQITEKGRDYLSGLQDLYERFTWGVDLVLHREEREKWKHPANAI